MSKEFVKNLRALARGYLVSPDDVVSDETLSLREKRELLASWAAEGHAGRDPQPPFNNGAVVSLDQIIRALRALSGEEDEEEKRAALRYGCSASRASASLLRSSKKLNPERHRDDDDDPPPCPTSNVLPLPPRFVPAFGRLVA